MLPVARLILHSDDFGLHPEINRAILEAADRGSLTSASLMVNGSAASAALEAARQRPSFGVGLHLNVVRGKPLSAPDQIPSLVGERGCFFNSAARLLVRSATGRISADEVYREYRAQFLYMLERDFPPTHLDGEKHSHLLLPESVEAVRRLQLEFDIPRVRIVRERPLIQMLRRAGIPVGGTWRQRMKLEFLERRAAKARKKLVGARSPAFCYGLLESGSIRKELALRVLESILGRQDDVTVEWMFHLGHPFDAEDPEFSAEFGGFHLDRSRYQELEFLLSSEVVSILNENRNKLASYRDL